MQERFPFCLFLFEALLRFRQRRHKVIPRIELAAAAVVALGAGVGNHIPGQLVIHRVNQRVLDRLPVGAHARAVVLAVLLAQGAQALKVGMRIAQIVAIAVGSEAFGRMVKRFCHVSDEVGERQIDGMLRVGQRRPRHGGHGGGQVVVNLDGRTVHLTLDADDADIGARQRR